MTTAAKNGQVAGIGTVVSIGGVTGGTDTYVPIGGILTTSFSGAKRDAVTNTSFDSSGVAAKMGTILDSGQVKITCKRISNDPGQLAAIAAFNAQPAANYDFQVQLPIDPEASQVTKGDSITFSALVSSAGDFDIDVSKISELTFTLDISGAKTVTAGA